MFEELNTRVEVEQTTQDYGRFRVEPLARGFGLTLGNALRRVLLSSLPGAAVTSMRVDGIWHEFSTIPGVREDTTELLLNLKQLRVKSHTDQPVTLRLDVVGPGVVTAGDIAAPPEVEITNPELQIATLDSPEARLSIEMTVEKGTGYLPADGREPGAIGVIPVDAIFTPIRRVNYSVEPTRRGARSDLDRLIIEVQTDGTIAPTEALAQAANILIEQFSMFAELQGPSRKGEKATLAAGTVPPRIADMPIEALDLSARTFNCLKRSQITKVGQILQMSESELLSLRNFGQKSLNELREKLALHGISVASTREGGPEGAEMEESGEEEGEFPVAVGEDDQEE